jgi:hypothetical protein
MTATQRERAKLHADEKSGTRVLDEVGAEVSKGVDFQFNRPAKTVVAALTDLACKSTNVFIANVQSVDSHPILDGTFIFSDYEVRVTEAFRGASLPGLGVGGLATVTRPGGAIVIDGKPVRATISTFPSLTLGDTYLFFGTYVPAAEAVRTTDWQGQFRLLNGRAVPVVWFHAIGVTSDGIDLDLVQRTLRNVTCR